MCIKDFLNANLSLQGSSEGSLAFLTRELFTLNECEELAKSVSLLPPRKDVEIVCGIIQWEEWEEIGKSGGGEAATFEVCSSISGIID